MSGWYTFFKFAVARPLVIGGWRGSIEGQENIPATGGAVLASNHISLVDTVVLPALLRRHLTFPAKAELFERTGSPQRRFVAWALKAVDQVPLDRSGGRASLDGLGPILAVLRAGGLAGIYPEGTRSPDGRLYKGKTGVARLALAAGVPIIAMSADAFDDDIQKCLEAGMNGHVAKPIDAEGLFAALSKTISRGSPPARTAD